MAPRVEACAIDSCVLNVFGDARPQSGALLGRLLSLRYPKTLVVDGAQMSLEPRAFSNGGWRVRRGIVKIPIGQARPLCVIGSK